MKTEQINIRLEPDLLAALERVAREESLERGDVIRRLLERSIERWELERAVHGYQSGDMSLGGAAEEAGITQWELLEAIRASGIAYPLRSQDVDERLSELFSEGFRTRLQWMETDVETLADIPPRPGGVLLIGINPAPISVAAGHYYQGRIGKRLWRRLERVGLLVNPQPGAEDEAFARAGHGLTDLVKRPTASSKELHEAEFEFGIEKLRSNVIEWNPALILFAFTEPARRLLANAVQPGPGPSFEGIPTFLLSGPYAAAAETKRINEELTRIIGDRVTETVSDGARSQRVTANDLAHGQIRLPRDAKRFFPPSREDVEVILRGRRLVCSYDPRTGPDRERSAVLRVGAALRDLVAEDEILRVSRGLAGIVQLD
ncbi:MAG TPA: uracil-DNA glycosylase family protein [Gaiellaceae bacterium]